MTGTRSWPPQDRVGLGVALDPKKMRPYTVSEFCLP